MKHFLLPLAFLFCLSSSYAQEGRIEGTLYERSTQEAWSYANIYLVGLSKGDVTDSSGYFSIDSLMPGNYDLRVSYAGLADTLLQNISISRDTVIQLSIPFPPYCPPPAESNSCPVCHKRNKVIPVVYSDLTRSVERQSRRGKIQHMGCMVPYCPPTWYCKRDGTYF